MLVIWTLNKFMWPFKKKIPLVIEDFISEKYVPCNTTPMECICNSIINDFDTIPITDWCFERSIGLNSSTWFKVGHFNIRYSIHFEENDSCGLWLNLTGLPADTLPLEIRKKIRIRLEKLLHDRKNYFEEISRLEKLEKLKGIFPNCFNA